MKSHLQERSIHIGLITLLVFFFSIRTVAQSNNLGKSTTSIVDEVDLISITSPNDTTYDGDANILKFTAKNVGSNTIYHLPIKVYKDSLLIISYNIFISGGILPNTTIEIYSSFTIVSPNHNYTLSVAIFDTVGVVNNSDSISLNVVVLPRPYEIELIELDVYPSDGDSTCIFSDTYVSFKIVNLGTEAVYNMEFTYMVYSPLYNHEVYYDTLLPGDTLSYYSNVSYPCPMGNYNIEGYASFGSSYIYRSNYIYKPLYGAGLDSYVCGMGIVENNLQRNFKIFPNPTEGAVNLDLSEFSNVDKLKISVLDLNLRELQLYSIEPNIKLLKLDLSNYSKGMYFIRIQSGNEVLGMEKVVLK